MRSRFRSGNGRSSLIGSRSQPVTHSREELVEQLLRKERVEIERVPMGRVVQEVPQVREEGDVTIIPVMQETAFVERRLVLKEEVRNPPYSRNAKLSGMRGIAQAGSSDYPCPCDSNQPAIPSAGT
jgi:hypothetical protein